MAQHNHHSENGGDGENNRKRRLSPPHFMRQQSQGATNQRVKRAINCWAMFPPPLPTSPSSAKKTIICQSRLAYESEEQQAFLEQQLKKNLVPSGKLPIVMPLDASKLVANHHIGITVRLREGERVGTAAASTNTNATATTSNNVEVSSKNLLGATIKIKRGKFAGMIGKIVECIEGSALAEKNIVKGKWYITDNLIISNAFQEHAFDVLAYADGDRTNKIDDVIVDGGNGDHVTQLRRETANNDDIAGATKGTVKNSFTKVGGVRGGANDKLLKQAPMGDTLAERSLVGATISVNTGRYKGFTGVVREKISVRRLQVDTVPVPLVLEDVQVLQYADAYTPGKDNDHRNNYDDKHFQQKLMGAKVRCISNEYSGTMGTIIRVLNLGHWYITDNPKIATALRASKFDVVKYADVPMLCIDDDDGDDTVKKVGEIEVEEKMADDADVLRLRENLSDNNKFVDTIMVEHQRLPGVIDAESINHLRVREDIRTGPNPAKFQHNSLPAENDQNRPAFDSDFLFAKSSIDTNDEEVTNDRDRGDNFAKSFVNEDCSNERSDAQTRIDNMAPKTNRMEVCSAKLPTIESIELAARLSAFDHVLFLANGFDKHGGGSHDTSHDFAEINQGGESSTMCITHIDEDASTNCASVFTPAVIANDGHPKTTQTNNDDVLATFVRNLYQRNLKSHNFPTAKVIPGMEIFMEKKQQPLRMVPLEERTVRVVPGSLEECSELAKRLSAFDEYLLML